ncbi:hypothetical protein ASD16_21290 [Cellulomonas sp. Root485]|nr:hypothetical protein ASD16_21290 [Cellulomonas sp. Root485]
MPTDASVAAYRWALDKAPDVAQQVRAISGSLPQLSVTPTEAGRHVLQVQTVDSAGNVSGIAKYTFRVGQAGIVAPDDGARVVQQVRLSVEAQPLLKFVSFEWRRGPDADATKKDVTKENLRTSTGALWSSKWAELPTGNGYTTWDAGSELGYQGGPAQVRAVLAKNASGDEATPTQWVSIIVDPDADGAATTTIGPGSVNLLTGDHTLSVTDAEEFGLSLVRTTSSRDTDSGYELQPNGLSKEQQEATSATGVAGSSPVSVDTTRFHSGTSSFKLTGAGGANNDSYASVGGDFGAMRLGLRAGGSYRISAWLLAPASTGLTPEHARGIGVSLFTRSGANPYSDPMATGQHTPAVTRTDGWQQVSVDVTIPADATEAFVRLYNGFAATSKTVYFDDITVQRLWSPFGPEWSTGSVDAASGSAYTRISTPYDDVAQIDLTGGGDIWFTRGDGGAWWPEPGAEALTLTATSASSWRVTELDGTITDFARTGSTGDFLVQSSMPPGASGAVRPVYDVATVPGVSRLSRLIAPIEPGVDGWPGNTAACTTPTPAIGCEVMQLDYATTTATTFPGSYTGRVATVSVWTLSADTMVKTPIANYAYNDQGRLVQVYDPRIVAAGDQAQITAYEYDTAGRLSQVTSPGDLPFKYAYGAAGKTKPNSGDLIDLGPGRLLKVTHAYLKEGTVDEVGGDNTTNVVYGVPLTRDDGGPYDLDPVSLAKWGQSDGPTDATAVFGPLDIPATNSATSAVPGKGGYAAATVSYMNASGLEVNTASPAANGAPVEGFIDTTEYDTRGNVVRTLDATNRMLALGTLSNAEQMLTDWGLQNKTELELARLFDSRTTYSDDGLDVLTTIGPIQLLAVANDPNDRQLLRARTTNTYDQGKPDGATYHLLTTTVVDGTDATLQSSVDPISTTNGYNPIDSAPKLGATSGWVHKQPTSIIVDAGNPTAPTSLTSLVLYDDRARAIRSSKPGSTGTDAGSTVSVFYTAGVNPADASCGNKPQWAGQPCLTKAAGPITGPGGTTLPANLPVDLPVKRVLDYNPFGSPRVVSESAGSGAAQVTRTSTTEYDLADRVVTVALSATGPGAGQAIATTKTTYDRVTGDVIKNASMNGSVETAAVSKQYDKLGRLIKYTDATGAWTTTTYNRLGQPKQVTDSIGTTRTYEYDRELEKRGLVTKITDSVAGASNAGDIVPTWGPDRQLESQTMPGGVTLTIGYDTARVPVSRTYTRTSDSEVIAKDWVVENHRGQWIQHTTNDTLTRSYKYDRLGRLTDVDDQPTGTSAMCTSRRYTYDNHTNRKTMTSAVGTQANKCPDATGAWSTTNYTYDTADRLITTSSPNGTAFTYDQLGRLTTLPTADGSTTATTAYFTNDLVAAQEIPGVKRTTWTLDPLQRFAQQNTAKWQNSAWQNPVQAVNHYNDDSDEPAWVNEDSTQPDNISRYVEGADGAIALQTGKTGARVLQLIDMHGDVIATAPIPDGQANFDWTKLTRRSYDEYGAPQTVASGATNAPRYGWLGGAQRSAETSTGTVLMGVRLYAPWLGRFLSVDPVPGGSATAYDYCNADPVNCTDLDGRFPLREAFKFAVMAVGVAASIACIVATAGICGVVAAGAAVASIGSNLYGAAKKEMTWRSFAANTAFDVVGGFVPGVRAVSRIPGIHSVKGEAVRVAMSVSRFAKARSIKNIPLKVAARFWPVRTAFRTGFNAYSAYHAVSGKWVPGRR